MRLLTTISHKEPPEFTETYGAGGPTFTMKASVRQALIKWC